MLQYEAAYKLYEEIRERMEKDAAGDEDLQDIYQELLKNAAEYAGTRTAWNFMDREARVEADPGRTALHNAYMSRLRAVCRNLGIEGIEELMPDRKMMGDFACFLALFLALEQR